MSEKRYSRRDFLEGGAKAALGIMIVPRFVLGRGYRAPSDKLDLAFVGIVESRHHFQQSRLACAVRPAQPDALAGRDLPRHVLEQHAFAE